MLAHSIFAALRQEQLPGGIRNRGGRGIRISRLQLRRAEDRGLAAGGAQAERLPVSVNYASPFLFTGKIETVRLDLE